MTKFKPAIVVVLAIFTSLLLFIIFDFLLGQSVLLANKALLDSEKPYIQLDYGWYELKKNFVGKDQYGSILFPVETDEHGFRKAPNSPSEKKYNFIFLGDSFTYGINGVWIDTFVGMFASKTGSKVINAGVSSYSPTAYLYQYKKALNEAALTDGHIVVVGIDISDVHDEASYWGWDEKVQLHPRKIGYLVNNPSNLEKSDANLRAKLRDSLPLTITIYRFIRDGLLTDNEVFTNFLNHRRSAFTWQEWPLLDKTTPYQVPMGYAPLGVDGGLKKIRGQLSKIVKLAAKNNSKVYFLIYPWPAQIAYPDKFDWSGWVQDLCINLSCAGVVDTITTFRILAETDKNWYETFYIARDMHFNERGNKVVSEQLVKSIFLK